jgi:predicted amidohydrolase YtcJ
MNRSLRLSLLALLALAPAVQAADLLVVNVNGYTLDSQGKLQHFQALLVDQGKVVATGDSADLAKRADGAKVLDGHGKTMLPGLIDAHGHIMDLGYALNSVDLTGTTSLDEALARIKAYATAHPDAKWIVGNGWNQVIWKLGRFPTAKELDSVVADRPVWMSRVDGHAGWANTAAIRLSGATKATKDTREGRIDRDADGNPAGVFIDGAMDMVNSKMPAPTPQEAATALDSALAELASVGLTGVDDPGIILSTYKIYRHYAYAH